ncbi:inositol polyphosphate 5-phosphatase [Skeletonema marinoi]|uniref:Inositol polyphosphate 5-phosphatase n=1 Tax=Skeletonema marinoi TaxID=267567 RepID=A0AAD9DB70_9STRA|nr:inositol polyphosphate 5-phosphatase [Skeletonema marinoi]
MALYCHRDVLGDVEMVNIADVTCGVGNVFHNKGAIGVYLKMKRQKNGVAKSSRMLFATGHLAAHVKNVDARNDDFKRIISGFECDGSYLLKSMDHVFFAGDLNYRVDLPREYVERCIIDIKDNRSCERLEEADDLMNKLLRRDQLLQTIASGRAFPQFSEGKITFLPTFKFDKGTQNYDTSHKQRVPAWTDRILFRSSKVNVLEYQSVPAATHSDHRPVFGTYQLGWGVTTKDSSRSRGDKRGRRNRKK